MKASASNRRQPYLLFLILSLLLMFTLPQNTYGHCDSYDGPVVQDALKAIETNKPDLVFKWVKVEYENEISDLFQKTLKYKPQGGEVYEIVKRHFLETLVRLHREGEGASYTGLKPAGTTSLIITMTDASLEQEDFESFMNKFAAHLERVVREKYQKVAALSKVKDHSVEEGRAYVAAYVDYTHTVEALHGILEHGTGHQH